MTSNSFYNNRKNWIWGIIIFVILACLQIIKGILLPFIMGIIIAYLFNPLVNRFERLHISRALSAALLIGVFFIVFICFFLFIIPLLQNEFLLIAKHMHYKEKFYQITQTFLDQFGELMGFQDIVTLKEKASSYFGDVFKWILSALAGVLSNTLALANFLSLIILTPVVSFYLLRDWPKFTYNIIQLLPRDQVSTIMQQMMKINQTLGSYFRGQCFVCFLLAIIYSFGLKTSGLDYAWSIGIMTGILAFIPYVGFAIGAISGICLALIQFDDWTSAGWVAFVFMIGQSVESYFLTPRLVGEQIGLHPVWIIFSLLTGGLLFGFVGMFLAMPVAATLGVLIRFSITKYFQSQFYLGYQENLKIKKDLEIL